MLEVILQTITSTANNTFIGTLFAGLIIAWVGLKLYKEQKKVDITSSRKEKLHDLAVELLTHTNVAVQDYVGQISIHDGSNPEAKAIFNKMESLSPGFASKDTAERFKEHISKIMRALHNLNTPLALNGKNESKVKALAHAIPTLTFMLSTASALSALPTNSLGELKKQCLELLEDTKDQLETIINE